jgi:hypothetical protein
MIQTGHVRAYLYTSCDANAYIIVYNVCTCEVQSVAPPSACVAAFRYDDVLACLRTDHECHMTPARCTMCDSTQTLHATTVVHGARHRTIRICSSTNGQKRYNIRHCEHKTYMKATVAVSTEGAIRNILNVW